MTSAQNDMRFRWPLVPLAAFIAILPLILHGYSCGHDFDFHVQSWLDAAQQMRHGTFDPHWTFSAAWNAGEPRFLFYPPLSWMLGAVLTLLVPINAAPIVFTWLALTGAGLAMDRLARAFVGPNTALIAAGLYLANPYILFTAYERTAYGELLAAAWLPLLLLAALRPRVRVAAVAVPMALLWLTNAPAAVMGCYAFALVMVVRLFLEAKTCAPDDRSRLWGMVGGASGGTVLGLALAGFYLLPAAYERKYVQVAMAIIPNMRYQDNFLFGHTNDVAHNVVLHTASLIALLLLGATFVVLGGGVALLRNRRSAFAGERGLWFTLGVLTVLIGLLLLPVSGPVWEHLPELKFLQFPWRLLSVLGVVLGLGCALLVERAKLRRLSAVFGMIVVVSVLTAAAIHTFRQGCELIDRPWYRAELFETHHGAGPTDEYTPGDADNDVLRTDNPGYWLAETPNDFAPGTIPNPAATNPNYDDTPPVEQLLSEQAPMHFVVTAPKAEFLLLNLRDYPSWDVEIADPNSLNTLRPAHIERDDGLIALPLYAAGTYAVNISWHRSWDQWTGIVLSFLAFVALCGFALGSRTLKGER